MPNTIHQEVILNSSPEKIYEALTSSIQFSALSDAPAEINLSPGGQFSCFNGVITGLTIEAIPGKRLVQAWRVGHWEPGIYSIVKFVLAETKPNETKLIFDHIGFPEEDFDHLNQGWYDRYWEPLKKYLTA